jgi:hypothetical protein
MVPSVNFDLSQEQEMLRRTVRDFAEREIGPIPREFSAATVAACDPSTRAISSTAMMYER